MKEKKSFKVYLRVYMEIIASSREDVLSTLENMNYSFTESKPDPSEIKELEIREWLDENETSY